jgi:hypothetical protein
MHRELSCYVDQCGLNADLCGLDADLCEQDEFFTNLNESIANDYSEDVDVNPDSGMNGSVPVLSGLMSGGVSVLLGPGSDGSSGTFSSWGLTVDGFGRVKLTGKRTK